MRFPHCGWLVWHHWAPALREVETSAPRSRRAFVTLYDHPVNKPLQNAVVSDTTAWSRLMILCAPGPACQLRVRGAPRPRPGLGWLAPHAPHTPPRAPPRGRLGFPAVWQSQGPQGAAPAQPASCPRAGARHGLGAAGRRVCGPPVPAGRRAAGYLASPSPSSQAAPHPGASRDGWRAGALVDTLHGLLHSGRPPPCKPPAFLGGGFDPETLAQGVCCPCGQVHLLDNRLVLRWEVGAHQEAGWKPGLPTRLRKDFPVQGLFPRPLGGLLSQEGASDGWGSRRGACVSRGASHTHTGASGPCAQPSAPRELQPRAAGRFQSGWPHFSLPGPGPRLGLPDQPVVWVPEPRRIPGLPWAGRVGAGVGGPAPGEGSGHHGRQDP